MASLVLEDASRFPGPAPGQAVIDLTDDPAEPSSHPQGHDHMSSIIELIRPKASDAAPSPVLKRRKKDTSGGAATFKKPRRKPSATFPSPRTLSNVTTTAFKPPPNITIPEALPTPLPTPARTLNFTSSPLTIRKPRRGPFPFLTLPPELRNKVYSLLLIHASPLELPRTARTAAARSAKWAECQSIRSRRAFKTIFLEILSTSRQVHDEATGILYGSNVFKFRSDHKEGPKQIPFPGKHLPLLKHIKVSVISREQDVEQDRWVAQLLMNFVEAKLEKFELTWYGWKRYCLLQDGLLCQALLALTVEKVFAVKIAGEARMEKVMLKELEGKCGAKKVEIQRPMISFIRNGTRIEVSDDEAES